MDPVKPLVSIAGGFRQLTAADLVAMNGALISITETGASTAKTLPDALAGKLNYNGTILQDASQGETHPFHLQRDTSGRTTYFYGNSNAVGLYDTKYGGVLNWTDSDRANLYGPNGRLWCAGNLTPLDLNTGGLSLGVAMFQNGYSGSTLSGFSSEGGGLQVRAPTSDGKSAAAMMFHRPGVYATWLGFDTDNALKFGGWSEGSNVYNIWSDKNPQISSRAINFRSKTFNIADYGTAPGASDATSAAANLNALNQATAALKGSPSGTGTILIPNETHYLQNQYVTYFRNGASLIGAGHNSALFLNNSNDPYGVVFHQDTNANYYSRLYVANLQIYARNCPNLGQGRLLSIRGTGISGGLNAESLWINGDTSAIPSAYMAIINGGTGQFKNIIIEGNQGSYGTSGTGYFISSDVLSTDLNMIACNVNRVGVAYQCIGGSAGNGNLAYTLEGVNFIQCIAVGVQQGVLATCPNYRCPLFYWIGGHINAQAYAFNLNGLGTIRIEAAQPQLDYNNSPQALIYATNVSSMRIAGNQFVMVDQLNSGKAPPVVSCIVAGSGCDNWQIVDNTMVNFQPSAPGVWNQNNAATNLYVGGNIKPGKGSNPLVLGNYTDMGYNVGN